MKIYADPPGYSLPYLTSEFVNRYTYDVRPHHGIECNQAMVKSIVLACGTRYPLTSTSTHQRISTGQAGTSKAFFPSET